jgi:hypothetical protein
MDTARLLDHYRISIADDKISVQILARLLKDGTQTQDDLSLELQVSLPILLEKLKNLYRANYVFVLSNSYWGITDLAKNFLSRLGLTEAVSEFLIGQQDLDTEDIGFLAHCVSEYQSNYRQILRRLFLIQSASFISDKVPDQPKSREFFKRLLYAIVIGLDENAINLGADDYCAKILRSWNRTKTAETKVSAGKHGATTSHFIELCHNALSDVRESNHFIIYGSRSSGKSSLIDAITYTRYLSFASSGISDESLQIALKDNTSTVIFLINSFDRSVSEASVEFLKRFSYFSQEQEDQRRNKTANEVFRGQFLQVLKEQENFSFKAGIQATLDLQDLKQPVSSSTEDITRLVTAIRVARQGIENQKSDPVTKSAMKRLLDEINSLQKAIRSWLVN